MYNNIIHTHTNFFFNDKICRRNLLFSILENCVNFHCIHARPSWIFLDESRRPIRVESKITEGNSKIISM